jgi:YfiH family protein
MIRFHGTPPTHLTFEALVALGLPHFSTTRHYPGITPSHSPASPLGRAAVAFFKTSGLDLSRAAFLSQVHGAQVRRAGRGGHAGKGDILLATTPGLPLAISTADCLAIVLADPRRRLLSVVHVGWRGAVKGAAARAVEALVALGAEPEALVIAISPSIGPCCYEVDHPVIGPLRRAFPDRSEAWITPAGSGKWMLDLWAANEAQLVDAGCRRDRIVNPRLCTACRSDLFFSYRKEGSRGRLITVAAL